MMRWLHLSDLHFQFDGFTFQTDTLRSTLVTKIKKEIELGGKIDYIFITGDIFHKGNTDKESIAEIKKLVSDIRQVSRCDKDKVIICPGNHDLERSEARKTALDYAISSIKKYGVFDYDGYKGVINNVNKTFYKACRTITGQTTKNDCYCIELEDINIYVLNTAVFAGQTYPGQKKEEAKPELEDTNLFICNKELFDLRTYDNREKLNIVLAHHGIECFESSQQEQFKTFLNAIHADLYLCGHVHKSIVTTIDAVNDGAKQFSCGGLFIDDYNAPSFIMGEYNPYRCEITIQNYQFIKAVGQWRMSNNLNTPYNEVGTATWTPNRFMSIRRQRGITSENQEYGHWGRYKFLKNLSTGLDRDRHFIDIRGRAREHVTILGTGMSKLSKYALTGPGSLKTLLEHVSIDLLMIDPEYLKDKIVAKELENFFGIPRFADNVKLSYDVLEKFCQDHNNSPDCKNRITLSVYSTIPTMSVVMIDENTNGAEAVIEFYGYHSGETRVLMSVQKNNYDIKKDIFLSTWEHIKEMRERCSRVVVK